MTKSVLLAFLVVCLACLIHEYESHSLPISAEMLAKIRKANAGRDLPIIWSFHIHCQFVLGEKDAVESALALRQSFVDHFNLTGVPLCKSTFDDVRLCMFGMFALLCQKKIIPES